MTELRAGAATDVGRIRPTNQDLLICEDGLYAVADGMGGHAGGEVAARLAIDSLRSAFRRNPTLDGLREAVGEANLAVWRQGQVQADLHGMGTTLTVVAAIGNRLAVANVGDSRAYLFSGGNFTQVTMDHSLAEEKVRQGEMTEAEAAVHPHRHILTRALGIGAEVQVDLWEIRVEVGDRLVLCSDGLSNEVSEAEMTSALRTWGEPAEAARSLVKMALDRGGHDNVTVVVIDVTTGQAPNGGAAIPAAVAGAAAGTALPASQTPKLAEKPQRMLTLRVGLFAVLVVGVLGAAYGFVRWYATNNWYVTITSDHLVIYQGRPHGLLWFKPSLVEKTQVTAQEILPVHLGALMADVQEPTLASARRFVKSLYSEFKTPGVGSTQTPTTPALPAGLGPPAAPVVTPPTTAPLPTTTPTGPGAPPTIPPTSSPSTVPPPPTTTRPTTHPTTIPPTTTTTPTTTPTSTTATT